MLGREMDERLRRQGAVSEARALDWRGLTAAAVATGLSCTTITAGLVELDLSTRRRAVEALRLRWPSTRCPSRPHAQCDYIIDLARRFLNRSRSATSVDAKKKELLGNYILDPPRSGLVLGNKW